MRLTRPILLLIRREYNKESGFIQEVSIPDADGGVRLVKHSKETGFLVGKITAAP
jgi:hypothetical protein